MIHINLKDNNQEELKPSDAWLERVKQYDTDLADNKKDAQAFSPKAKNTITCDLSTTKGRKQYFEFLGDLWNDNNINLKEKFFENDNIVGSKCWYSEVDSIGAELEIEHFRPKGIVSNLDYTEVLGPKTWHLLNQPLDEQQKRDIGYYWLAYNWRNYRLSCKISNTVKHNYFPLLPNSPIAYKPNEEENELPVLIDPLIASDVVLLSFEKKGDKEVIVVPSVSLPIINGEYYGDKESFRDEEVSEADKWQYIRAEVSIWVYELNEMKKVQKSRGEVWIDTEELLNNIIKNTDDIEDLFKKVQNKVNKKAKHAAVARQVVTEFKLSGKISHEIFITCCENMDV